MDTTVPPQTTEFFKNEFSNYINIIETNYTYIDNYNTRPRTPDQPTDKTMPGAPKKK
jgi:hypothetical protein